MKTSLYLLSCVMVMGSSCTQNLYDEDKGGDKGNPVVEIAAIESMSEYQVPVREGAMSIVKLGDDTLAVTSQSLPILVPKDALKAGKVTVEYEKSVVTKSGGFDQYSFYANYWHYLSFEDTRKGDYDYNDVVLHCRVISSAPWNSDVYTHTVAVQPVALGGSIDLKLGIVYRPDPNSEELVEKIICENIREKLFFGNPIFPINTDSKKEIKKVTNYLTDLFKFQNKSATFPVIWFIESGSDRLYAASTNFDADQRFDMVSPDGLPYGISLTEKWDYPIEKKHIKEAYPDFYDWVTKGDERVLLGKKVKENTFPAVKTSANAIDLWDWAEKK